ncbi:hypothetical protein FHX77_001222 [Bifidobacterium commune]|uniref:hypothetical protein n=1 Tax=Bifidobacterium commune TaxID=1505727 RepID=UPI001178B93A|nr:hypothetical protein [Bifidobacterium commune]MBB2955790.1 hypothetical protein [Bifidobacterium commune]
MVIALSLTTCVCFTPLSANAADIQLSDSQVDGILDEYAAQIQNDYSGIASRADENNEESLLAKKNSEQKSMAPENRNDPKER